MAERVASSRNIDLATFEYPGLASPKMVAPCKRTGVVWVVPVMLLMGLLMGCSDSEQDAASTMPKPSSAPKAQTDTAKGSAAAPRTAAAPERWYDSEHVTRGDALFAQHCASCHGKNGEGAFTWRQVGADGKYPPPPVNGTGHAWHHPIQVLGAQIKWGAPGGKGNMPPFKDRLSDQQIVEVIASFQDRWSDEVYAQWWDIEMRSRQ